MTSTASIILVGGSKGGVGKSFVTMSVLDYLRDPAPPIATKLVESDTSNPDVEKSYRDEVDCSLIDLDKADGWIELLNLCEANPKAAVVINTAARNHEGVSKYGEMLKNTLGELNRNLVTLWVINRQRDCLELLRSFMEVIPTTESTMLHVVRNGYFGDESKFELYGESKIRKAVESAGGKSVTFPDLADRVADDIYSKRLTIEQASKSLPIGNRAELERWRREMRKVMAEVIA